MPVLPNTGRRAWGQPAKTSAEVPPGALAAACKPDMIASRKAGGILTRRDLKFVEDSSIPVAKVMTTKALRMRVRLTHMGMSAPWPGSFSGVQPDRVGVVRLLVTLTDRTGRVVLTAYWLVEQRMKRT